MLPCLYMAMGRPSDFTQEIADKVCAGVAQGISLRTLCKNEDLPSIQTIFSWFRLHKDFLEQYERAKEQSAVADDETLQELNDLVIEESKKEDFKRANAVVAAYKLKADNLKWAMSKKQPKKYGDKLDHTTNGKDLPIAILSHVQRDDGNKKDTGVV